jgi:protein O-mannosyl-transferase
MRRRRFVFLAAFALAALTIAVYAPVRHYGFINFDDAQYVSRNAAVLDGLTWSGVRWAFTTGHEGNWHPITWMSHMLDIEWFGLDAGRHHLVNLLVHLANALLLFWLLLRMTGALWQSAIVSALFAVHPMHVESVAWIAERKDVLSGFFWMLTLLAYVSYARDRTPWRYGVVVICFVLGLMAKPMVVTLPFVLLLIDIWPLQRVKERGVIAEKVPLLVLSLVCSIVTFIVQRNAGAVKGLASLPLERRVENAVVAYAKYVAMTIWPSGLAPLYPYEPSIPTATFILALAALVAITVVAVRGRARHPYVVVGWLMFIGMLVPVIGLVQVGSQPMADRYTYLPSIGLFIIAVWGLSEVPTGWRHRTTMLAAVAFLAVASCAAAARAQVGFWPDSVALWQHTVSVTANNYRAHSNLGQALYTEGRIDEAIAEYRAALAIDPDFAEASNYLGTALSDRGDIDQAIAAYREALRVLPTFAEAHNNLGLALSRQQKFADAEAEFREAMRLDPRRAATRSNLGITLARTGRIDDAIEVFTEALALQPDSTETRHNLATAQRDRGETLADGGHLDAALDAFHQAEAIAPDDPEIHFDLGLTLAKKGLAAEAMNEARRTLQLAPEHQDAKRLLEDLSRH